ncbi:unnamed protein product [Caenorhabditis brenneri]
MKFLNIVMLGIALVGYAQVASVVPVRTCTRSERSIVWSCVSRIMDFDLKSLVKIEMKDKSEMKEFERFCNLFDCCQRFVGHCDGYNDENARKMFTKARTFCGTVKYISNEFAACAKKIENSNSTCKYNFDLSLNDEEHEDKKKVEEECKKIFGEEQCLKEEVLEHCSKKDWEEYRDHYITMNEVFKLCDFKNVV